MARNSTWNAIQILTGPLTNLGSFTKLLGELYLDTTNVNLYVGTGTGSTDYARLTNRVFLDVYSNRPDVATTINGDIFIASDRNNTAYMSNGSLWTTLNGLPVYGEAQNGQYAKVVAGVVQWTTLSASELSAILTSSTPTTIAVQDVGAVGDATTAARANHQHASPGLATSGSPGTDGFMSKAYANKLSGATDAATASKLVQRDASGYFKILDAVAAGDPVSLQQLQAAIQGIKAKTAVLAATTEPINLATFGLSAVDTTITPVDGDRILVKNQTLSKENGIYIAHTTAWTRATDMATYEQSVGAFVFVERGSTQADTGWLASQDLPGTIDVDPITFVQFSAAGIITVGNTAGSGLGLVLAKSGNNYPIKTISSANKGLVLAANVDGLTVDMTITVDGSTIEVHGTNGIQIKDAGVTLAKLSNLSAPGTLIGRYSTGTGVPQEVSLPTDATVSGAAMSIDSSTGVISVTRIFAGTF